VTSFRGKLTHGTWRKPDLDFVQNELKAKLGDRGKSSRGGTLVGDGSATPTVLVISTSPAADVVQRLLNQALD
jgi:hypothetical protein